MNSDRSSKSQPQINQTIAILMTEPPLCHHCQGEGYSEIRDCSGEIQREETCLFCSGTGILKKQEDED